MATFRTTAYSQCALLGSREVESSSNLNLFSSEGVKCTAVEAVPTGGAIVVLHAYVTLDSQLWLRSDLKCRIFGSLTDYRSRVCFSLCVYANVIVGSQLRLMYGPETNHQSIQIIRAYSNGEREPKGPETRKRNAQAGRFEWIETRTDGSSTWCSLPQWWVMHLRPLFSLRAGCIELM